MERDTRGKQEWEGDRCAKFDKNEWSKRGRERQMDVFSRVFVETQEISLLGLI